MYSGRQPWVRFRRRAAMWFLAAWAMFNISHAFAGCCAPSVDPVHAPVAVASLQHHAATEDDCCDTDTLDQRCPMVLDEGAPTLAAPIADCTVRALNQAPIAPPLQVSSLVPAILVDEGHTRVPIPPAPPDPIFLRLQRFLI